MRALRNIALGLLLAPVAAPLWAHEFWIDAEVWKVAPEAALRADLKVGEEFKGASYSYRPRDFTRFDVVQGDLVTPVEGRPGDRPALKQPGEEGLAVIVHVTTNNRLTYSEWEKFVAFCKHKDFEWALARHLERGLPQTDFRERYSRHAKALMAVGHGRGADRELGLETEIVAEANPYTDDMSAGLPIRVLDQGAPRADAQVELFERDPDGAVLVTLHRTDADGRVSLPVKPGHTYLADAVVMREIGPDPEMRAVWDSLWASLTFEVPK